jgi:hypothetical protein
MGDMGDIFKAARAHTQDLKERWGVDCPGCPKVQPKRTPTRLLPGQRCRVCHYVDPRPRETEPDAR